MFSPYRLTTEQYALMRAVQREPGVRQVDVKDRIFAEPNTVTAMVNLLERRGILRRRPSPVDGRVRLLYLTAHGQAVMKRLSDDWEPMRALLRKSFAGNDGQQALEILDCVYTEMEEARGRLLKNAYIEDPGCFEPNSGPSHKKAASRVRAVSAGARRKKDSNSATAEKIRP